jgi:pimeloyl-ACP methyl ester carboxylesterase
MLADIEPTRESLARFVQILARPDWPGSARCIDERLKNALKPGHWEALAAPRLRRAGADTSDREVDEYPKSLSHCRVPLLVIEGSEDELLEDDWAARVAINAPLGNSAKLASRHSPNLDCAPEIARLLREFERSLRQSAPGND